MAAAVHVISPGEIDIPRNGDPLTSVWVSEEVVVLTIGDIVMVNCFDDRSIAVVAGQIDVFTNPIGAGIALAKVAKEEVEVGVIGRLICTEAGEFPLAEHHLVKIAIGEVVFLDEVGVFILDGEVEAPKIASVLVGRIFVLFADDPEGDPMGAGSWDTDEIEQSEADGFVEACFTASTVVTLLDAGAEIEFAPRDFVGAAVVVGGAQAVAFVEVNFPHVFAHGMAPDAAARAEAHVVVDDSIDHECAGVEVFLG